jgi:hypothetical protein
LFPEKNADGESRHPAMYVCRVVRVQCVGALAGMGLEFIRRLN